jgi:cytochrome c-type biogenesis protein CcmH/NrfF
MKASISSLPIASQAAVKLQLDVTANLNITPFAARQQVNQFLLERVGNYLSAGEPELAIEECLYWRVPVIYALPRRGKLGQVGACIVDVQTGEAQIAPESPTIEEMEKHAEFLYSDSTPSTGA